MVFSPSKPLAISTVKIGADDFTVSVKETATYFRATKPNSTVVKLQQNNIQWEKVYYLQHVSSHSNTWSFYSTSWIWRLLELGMMRGAHSHSGRSAWLGLNLRPRNINPPALSHYIPFICDDSTPGQRPPFCMPIRYSSWQLRETTNWIKQVHKMQNIAKLISVETPPSVRASL